MRHRLASIPLPPGDFCLRVRMLHKGPWQQAALTRLRWRLERLGRRPQDERVVDNADLVRIVNPGGDRLLSGRFGFMRQPRVKAEVPESANTSSKQKGVSRCPACRLRRPRDRRWQAIRRQVFARYGRVCHVCGAPATDIDHIIPIADDGGDELGNLRPACQKCNRGRH